MAYRTIINNFTAGELDPRFLAMVDYENYHKGCRALANTVGIPQGGCTRRFGSNYTDIIVDRTDSNTPITNINQVRILGYEYDASEKYDVVIRPDSHLDGGQPVNIAFDIYTGDVLVATVYPPANTYTLDEIRELRWTTATDRVIFFHNDHQFGQLIRNSMVSWEFKLVTLQHFPTFDYTILDDPANPYTASGETFTPTGTTGTVTVARSAGTSTPFTDNHVGGLIIGNGGILRITTINSNISVTGYTLENFTDLTAIRGEDIYIAEKAWGDGSNSVVLGVARGWPAHGTFYQTRLIAASWKYEPGRASASIVNGPYNFDDSDDDATTGYSFLIGDEGNDVIQDILSYKSLICLGAKGPAATSILLDQPTTPTNVFVNTQGTEKAANIDGKIVNNMVLYVGSNFDKVWSMSYDIPDTGYSMTNISALSAHLITEGRWADVFSPTEKDGKYYLLVNEDGSMATLLLISEENIRSWTPAKTVGSYIDVAATGDECKVLVRRQVNTGSTVSGSPDKTYIVERTFNVYTDVTTEIDTPSNVTFFSQDESYIVLGNEIKFTRVHVEFDTPASADVGLVFEYLDNNGSWQTFTPTDATTGFTLDGDISWNYSDVPNWEAQELNKVRRKYWIRIRRTTDVVATAPIVDLLRMNTASRIYRESLDFSVYMDCQIDTTADGSGNVSGISPLAGQAAFVFADGFPVGTYNVSSTGTIALGATYANANISVGLDYKPSIIPMPLVAFLQNGYNLYHPQHIVDGYIDYYESLGIVVNGQRIQDEGDGAYLTIKVPEPETGFFEIPVHKGWDPRQEIEITQSYPAPMTLLGIGLTVEVT